MNANVPLSVSALTPEAQREWVDRHVDEVNERLALALTENETLKQIVEAGGSQPVEVNKRIAAERQRDDARRELDQLQRRIALDEGSDSDAIVRENARLNGLLGDQQKDLARVQSELEELRSVVGEGDDLQTEIDRRLEAEQRYADVRRELDQLERTVARQESTRSEVDEADTQRLGLEKHVTDLEAELARSQAEVERMRAVVGDEQDLQSQINRSTEAEQRCRALQRELDEVQRRSAIEEARAPAEAAVQHSDLSRRLAEAEAQRRSSDVELERLRFVVGSNEDIEAERGRRRAAELERDEAMRDLDEAQRRLALGASAETKNDAHDNARTAAEERASRLEAALGQAQDENERLLAIVGDQGDIESERKLRLEAEEQLVIAHRQIDQLKRDISLKDSLLRTAIERT